MIVYFVLKSAPVLERYRIDDEMTVQIVRIQMDGHNDLIFVCPHSPRCLLAYLKRFVRRDLAFGKALKPVPRDDISAAAKALLNGDHFRVGVPLGTVDCININLFIDLFVVFNVPERVVKIVVEVIARRGFVRVFGVFDYVFQPALYRPESDCCNRSSLPSFSDISDCRSRNFYNLYNKNASLGRVSRPKRHLQRVLQR